MSYSFATQSAGLRSIANARELGGLVLPDGSRIKRGLLLRGGSLATASDEDLRRLREDFQLKKIFDFRTSIELKLAPDRPVDGVRNLWFPAFDEESQTMQEMSLPQEAYRDLGPWLVRMASDAKVQEIARNFYLTMVSNDFTQVQYAGFLQNIVNTPDGAVYWHCSQGKDRTGIASAFLLAALGADRELIMKDFAISKEYYREELEPYLEQVGTREEKEAIETFISVNCGCFEAALDWIDASFGSMDEFLKGPLCLDGNDIRTLKERYLEH